VVLQHKLVSDERYRMEISVAAVNELDPNFPTLLCFIDWWLHLPPVEHISHIFAILNAAGEEEENKT